MSNERVTTMYPMRVCLTKEQLVWVCQEAETKGLTEEALIEFCVLTCMTTLSKLNKELES